jgi:hypothetical protein
MLMTRDTSQLNQGGSSHVSVSAHILMVLNAESRAVNNTERTCWHAACVALRDQL